MIWLQLAWAYFVRAYYARALEELERRQQHHSNEWAYVWWKKRACDDRVAQLERTINNGLHR